jgi:hypothetical protein
MELAQKWLVVELGYQLEMELVEKLLVVELGCQLEKVLGW